MSVAARAAGPVGPSAPDGDRTTALLGRRRCEVVLSEAIGPYRLVGVADREGPSPQPGQFYMLSTASDWGEGTAEGTSQRPYLARAFSVCRRRDERLDFLVEEIGPGTRRLAALRPGDGMLLVGPLGAGFTVAPEQDAVLVGGGAGIAPLVILADALEAAGSPARALLGFRSAAYGDAAGLIPCAVEVATDDGSLGHAGRVTELLERELDRRAARVYACGPPLMLEEVRRICNGRGLAAELALEEAMACGFGACFGCVVRTKSGYRRICIDGPVVKADLLADGWLDA
jgi:dihydroorotate dehydrogenase electron transfer subunit